MIKSRPKARLVLENGMVFAGRGFGAVEAESTGEVVFNTAMTGYQEILTDPSYYGQIVTFTYPHIGNVGVNRFDVESNRVQAAGLVVRELSRIRSNWRSEDTLEAYLAEQGILGIEGVDTRMIVKTIREEGAMRAIITCRDATDAEILKRVQDIPQMSGLDLTPYVTTDKPFEWLPRDRSGYLLPPSSTLPKRSSPFHVAVLDFGVKWNILERLSAHGCRCTVFPASATAEEVLAIEPDGIFVSNGPGDPDAVTHGINTVKELMGRKPMFGICLGHQLLALALGASTYKMKFGHRGANHPVQQLDTGRNEITSQNHGFAVDRESLESLPISLTHVNLNDDTVEGFAHRDLPLFCVQYHPEASPGPHDADYLFGRFVRSMEAFESASGAGAASPREDSEAREQSAAS